MLKREKESYVRRRRKGKEITCTCNFTNIFCLSLSFRVDGGGRVVEMNHILLLQSHIMNSVQPLRLIGSLMAADKMMMHSVTPPPIRGERRIRAE